MLAQPKTRIEYALPEAAIPKGKKVMKRIVAVLALALASPLPAVAQSDETCIAYMEADAAHQAAQQEARATHRAEITPASKVRNAANATIEKQRMACRRDLSCDHFAFNHVADGRRNAAYDAFETATRPADARLDAALQEASAAWGQAYARAYQGPTSDIQSVFQKLVLADRERCRLRFGQ